MAFMVQLVVYRPGGIRRGVLPDVLSLGPVSSVYNDIGGLSFTYPKSGTNYEFISPDNGDDGYFEIAVEFSAGGSWTEPANCRFIGLTSTDDTVEVEGTVNFNCPSYGWLLKKALVWNNSLNTDRKREFTNATAGTIVKTILEEAKGGGFAPHMSYSFTSGADSTGSNWNLSIPKIEFGPAMDLYNILINLAQQGVCDWLFQGRELRLVRPDVSLAIDRSNDIVLRYGQGITDAPNKRDASNLVHRALVVGEGTTNFVRNNSASATMAKPWGVWGAVIEQGGVNDPGTMAAFADAALATGASRQQQLTRTLDFSAVDTLSAFPFLILTPGSYITAPNALGVSEKLRIREVNLSYNQGGDGVMTASVILNDRILEKEIRETRRTVAIVGGSTAGGGSGSRPTTEDKRTPKAPTNVAVASDAYLDGNGRVTYARAQVTWSATTQATDNTAQDISGYRVMWRKNATNASWSAMDAPSGTTAFISPLESNTGYYFAVVARATNGKESSWAQVGPHVTAVDAVPPPVPSTPTVTSEKGVLVVTWDGKGQSNEGQPADYAQTIVHMGTTSSFTPAASNAVDTLTGPGKSYIGSLDYGQVRYFKLVSNDMSGNKSAPSTVVSQTVQPFLDAEILNGANLIDYSVDGTKAIAAGTIDTTRLRVGQANLITDPWLKNDELCAFRTAQSSKPANISYPNESNEKRSVRVASDASVAVEYFFTTPAAPNKYTAIPVVGGEVYHVAIKMWVQTALSQAAKVRLVYQNQDSSLTVVDLGTSQVAQSLVYTWTAPTSAVNATLLVRHEPGSGAVFWRDPDFRRKVPGVLIEDGAVTADKILANTIETGHLKAGAVTASVLDANAINGKTITGAIIRTAAATQRVQMDSAGISQYNSSGVLMSQWTTSGFNFRTAVNGRRVEFNSNGIAAFDSLGRQTIKIDGTSGDLEISGIFRSADDGFYPRVEINNALWSNNYFGTRFFTTGSHQGWPEIKAKGGSSGGQGELTITSGEVNNSNNPTGHSYFFLRPNNVSGVEWGWGIGMRRSGQSPTYARIEGTVDDLQLNGEVIRLNSESTIRMQGTQTQIFGNSVHFDVSSTQHFLINSSSRFVIASAGVEVRGAPFRATAFQVLTSGVTALLGSDGRLDRIQSLGKYKLEQEELELDYDVLELTPKTWVDRTKREANPLYGARTAGFIAEDVEAFSNARHRKYETLLLYGNDGELEGVQYDRLGPMLLLVARDLHRRVTELENNTNNAQGGQ